MPGRNWTIGWADYAQGQLDYEDGLQEYRDGEQEYQDGLEEYRDGKEELKDGEEELEYGWEQLQDGVRQYNDALAKFEAGKAELEAREAEWEAGSPACGKNCFRRWNSSSREPTCPTTRTMPPCWRDWREVTALSSTVPWTVPGIRSRRGSPPWKPSSGNWPRAIPRRYSSSWTL